MIYSKHFHTLSQFVRVPSPSSKLFIIQSGRCNNNSIQTNSNRARFEGVFSAFSDVDFSCLFFSLFLHFYYAENQTMVAMSKVKYISRLYLPVFQSATLFGMSLCLLYEMFKCNILMLTSLGLDVLHKLDLLNM